MNTLFNNVEEFREWVLTSHPYAMKSLKKGRSEMVYSEEFGTQYFKGKHPVVLISPYFFKYATKKSPTLAQKDLPIYLTFDKTKLRFNSIDKFGNVFYRVVKIQP